MRIIPIIFIFFLLLSAVSISRAAIVIRVPQDFPTIQDALNFAFDGDTIQVSPGTYIENITIRKSVTLIGMNKDTTIIDGNGANQTIRVSANNVHITGFTIRNGVDGIHVGRSSGVIIDNNRLTGCNSSIHVSQNSVGTTVSGNLVANNLDTGIRLYNTSSNVVTGNTILNSVQGISLGSYTNSNNISSNTLTGNEYAIRLYNTTGNTVQANSITNNEHGIYIFGNSSGNTIRNNPISNNKYGFQLIGSKFNTATNNTLNGNGNNFWVYGESLDEFIQNIDTLNTVNGKPVYYWVSHQNQQVPLDAGYVAIVNSTDITVKDLTLKSNYHGVLLAYSNNSIVQNVVARNNTYGIFIRTSTNSSLTGNTMIDNTNNFGVYGTTLAHFIHNITSSNTVNGKPIYYWTNQNAKTVPTDAGYVAVVNSTGVTVKNLTVTSNYQGILFAYTNGSTIQNVRAIGNQYGFYIDYSVGNTITDNSVEFNSHRGIYLFSSNTSLITNNKIVLNTGAALKIHWESSFNTVSNNLISINELGIWTDSASNNVLYHNSLIGNTLQATSFNGTNTWNDNANTGNYWSDYTGQDLNHDGIGDTLIPHLLLDYYPLMTPWTPVADIAVVNVVPLKLYGSPVYPIRVNVTLANFGNSSVTFDISLIAGVTLLAKQTVSMSAGSSVTTTVIWKTTGYAKGNYTLQAQASAVPSEVDTTDNTYLDGWILLTIPGDVNGDGKVDIFDAIVLSSSFGSNPSKTNWNGNADINSDNIVDIFDAIILAGNFGKKA